MTAIAFCEEGLTNAKRALRAAFAHDKSSHLTEALAAACGYKTNAALLAAMAKQDPSDPDFILIDDDAFGRRMNELSPGWQTTDDRWFEALPCPSRELVIKTSTANQSAKTYKSQRHQAWRNLIVAGLNAGLERRLFSVRPNDNRWEGENDQPRKSIVFEFEIDGIPALASLRNAGFDELSIHVACWPTAEGRRWVDAAMAGFLAGDVYASGWLERREGAWLQYTKDPDIWCRKARLAQVAGLNVKPRGYADRGPFARSPSMSGFALCALGSAAGAVGAARRERRWPKIKRTPIS